MRLGGTLYSYDAVTGKPDSTEVLEANIQGAIPGRHTQRQDKGKPQAIKLGFG
jgi:hypothetical protein